jgi:hypothetical protein
VHNERDDDTAATHIHEATAPDGASRLVIFLALCVLLPACLFFFTLARAAANQRPSSSDSQNTATQPTSSTTLTYAWGGANGRALTVRGTGFAPNESVAIHAAIALDASIGTWVFIAATQAAADGSISVNDIELGPQLDQINGWRLIARGASGALATAGPLEVPPTPTPLPTLTPEPTLTPLPLPTDTPPAPTPEQTVIVTTPTPSFPLPNPDLWYEEYFSNRDFYGTPAFARNDTPVLFYKWGRTPPSPYLNIKNFSAIFTRTVTFPYTGTVLFELQVTGAARMSVNGGIVIDQWFMGPYRKQVASVPVMGNVPYQIKVEYYNSKQAATICLEWKWGEFTGWQGRYYASDGYNPIMPPLMIRNDDQIDFTWGFGSPGGGVPDDNFSVIWTRNVHFPASGQYRFVAEVDDWMRVFIDGKEVAGLNNFGGKPGRREAIVKLRRGKHHIEVRYVEKNFWAKAKFYWEYIIAVPTRVPPQLCTGSDC